MGSEETSFAPLMILKTFLESAAADIVAADIAEVSEKKNRQKQKVFQTQEVVVARVHDVGKVAEKKQGIQQEAYDNAETTATTGAYYREIGDWHSGVHVLHRPTRLQKSGHRLRELSV